MQCFHSLPYRKDIEMSAFLGPIHFWLYHKIQLQEELICRILETAARKDWNLVSAEKLDTVCGKSDMRPLESVIDQRNIHGWLHHRIDISEMRLAFLVTELLKEDSSRLAILKQTAYRFGERNPLEYGISADGAFKALEDSLLDGMPCDHVNRIIEHGENKVVWQQTQCVHHLCWEQTGGDVSVYYALRAKMIDGMLMHSGLRFYTARNNEFKIIKE